MISGGSGPDAVRGQTYHDIQIENAELDGSIQRRKPGSEVPTLPSVPHNPANVWNTGDRGPPPPLGNGGKDE